MARTGNPASVSDAGVGALAARAAIRGAGLNVRINLGGLGDPAAAKKMKEEATALLLQAEAAEGKVLALVDAAMEKS